MTEYDKKLRYLRDNETYDIALYDSEADIGGGNSALAVKCSSDIAYAAVGSITNADATHLRVRKSGETKAILAKQGMYWEGIGSGTNGVINAMAIFENELYVAGLFTLAGGTPVSNIARWDGESWASVGEIDGEVHALKVYDGGLVAGGAFVHADGLTVNRVAKWNGTAWESMGDGFNLRYPASNVVYTLEAMPWQDSTTLFAGGRLFPYDTISDTAVMRYVPDTNSWTRHIYFDLNNYIFKLKNIDGTLAMAGWFSRDAQSPGYPPYGGKGILLGGREGQVGGGVHHWTSQSHETSSYWGVCDVAKYKDDMYVAGGFELVGNAYTGNELAVKHIAKWDGTSWHDLDGGLDNNTYFEKRAKALIVYEDELYVGGDFTHAAAGLNPRIVSRSVAKWNGDSWVPLLEGFEGSVRGFIEFNGKLLVCGDFTETTSGTVVNNIAQSTRPDS